MASFTYTAGDTWITITARGLTSGQRVRFFVRKEPGTLAVIDESYTTTSTTLTKTFEGLNPSTSYAVNVGTGNTTSWIGVQYFTTMDSSGGGGATRPNDWQWWSNIYQGAPINISANEWNSFCSRINEFRAFRGMSNYSFTTVWSGTPISASIVDQAINAISGMSGHGTLPATVYSGSTITANFFLQLKTALNWIE